MVNAAQDEFDQLIARNTTSRFSHHPDDADSDFDSPAASDDETRHHAGANGWKSGTSGGFAARSSIRSGRVGRGAGGVKGLGGDEDEEDDDDDDDNDDDGGEGYGRQSISGGAIGRRKTTTDHFPSRNRVAPANTGPKGVISDAWAAADKERLRTAGLAQAASNGRQLDGDADGTGVRAGDWEKGAAYGRSADSEEEGEEEDEDDGYMQEWRQNRMREMAASRRNGGGNGSGGGGGAAGKRGGYSGMKVVDAFEYLEIVESAPKDTVVAVFIFDEDHHLTPPYTSHLLSLASQHPQTHFIALSHTDAEIDEAGVPALLAYRNGEQFAALVPLVEEVPFTCNVVTNLREACGRYGII